MRVSFFVTCVVDLLAPDTGHAAVDVLEAAGHNVSFAADQTCCGQPAWNAGATGPAAAVAATSLRALVDDGAEAVVVPAGSCATMMKVFWPQLFDQVGDPAAVEAAEELAGRVHEFSSFLEAHGLPQLRSHSETVAYHHSCHMLRELRLHDEPEASLRRAGCELSPWDDDERCCGFGGLFSVKLPEASVAMADQKLDSLPGDELVGSDTSCLLHLATRAERRGRPLRARHVADVLAERLEREERGG